jgi:GT2 family glycosyltransferase
MILLTGSIVLYKSDPEILAQTVCSFLNSKSAAILYLIDNSPTSALKNLFSDNRIIYYHNPGNPGFGASHNFAIKESIKIKSKFHVVLNPDIYFEDDTLEKLIDFMNSNLSVGQVMPKVLSPNGTFQYLCKNNPTFFDLFARGFLSKRVKKLFQNRLDRFENRNSDFNNIIFDVPYLSGCFMFFRISSLIECGLFDEKIFMYLEDADLTRRVLNVSRTAYYPFATVYHHYSGLTHKKWKYKWITIKSAIIYFNKWGWVRSLY